MASRVPLASETFGVPERSRAVRSSLPIVDDYLAPLSLQEFLLRYFFLRVTYMASADPRGSQLESAALDTCPQTALLLPPAEYRVSVYVHQGAPPPPPLQQHIRTRHENRIDVSSLVVSATTAEIVRRCLSRPLWEVLFERLGPSGCGFVVGYCAVVAQFDVDSGAMHLFGRTLSTHLPLESRRRCAPSARLRDAAVQKSARIASVPGKRRRIEAAAWSAAAENAVGRTDDVLAYSRMEAALRSQNVTRLSLIDDALWGGAFSSRSCELSDTADFAACARGMSEALFRATSEGSLHTGGESLWSVADLTRLTQETFHVTLSAPAFQGTATTTVHESEREDEHNVASTPGSRRGLFFHLLHVVRTFSAELRRTVALADVNSSYDDRGRHGITLGDASASTNQVLSCLRRVLSEMRWQPQKGETTSQRRVHTFWSRRQLSSDVNTKVAPATPCGVLEELLSGIGKWLEFGKRGHYPLHVFLHGVNVNDVPWLSECRISDAKRRSQVQQRLWLEFCRFLLLGPVPLLVRRWFHVSWSPKNWNQLRCFHRGLWEALVRKELARIRNSSSCDAGGVDAQAGAMRLRPLMRTDVVSRTLTSPLGVSLLYSAVRLLPDGKKLRPIAVVRLGSGFGLGQLAFRWRLAAFRRRSGCTQQEETGERMVRTARSVASRKRSRKAAQRGDVPQQKVLRGLSLAGRRRTSRSAVAGATPNRSILRLALQCLGCGIEERQRVVGHAARSTRTHGDEYSAWRHFVSCCRQHNQMSGDSQLPVEMHVVRADASRCFDRLPQDRVREIIAALVPHTTYHGVEGLVVRCGPQSDVQSPPRCFVREGWSRLVPEADFARGIVRGIPRSWILEVAASPNKHVSAFCPAATLPGGAISGTVVREILLQHTTSHMVVIGRRLYEQRTGITQGSAVASLLCDAILSEVVDGPLAAVLEEHSPSAPILFLRRMDDILVASPSWSTIAAAATQLMQGWPQSGFVCNHDKLKLVSTPPRGASAASATAGWCGLRFDPSTGHLSVDWSRLLSRRGCFSPSSTCVFPRCEADIVASLVRWTSALCARVPLTVLCGTLNSPTRVLQTLAEVSLLWSRLLVHKLMAASSFCRPHVRCVLRPLALSARLLSRHLQNAGAFLVRRGGLGVAELRLDDGSVVSLSQLLAAGLQCTVASAMRWLIAAPVGATQNNAAQKWPKEFWVTVLRLCRSKSGGSSHSVADAKRLACLMRSAEAALKTSPS